MRTHTMHRDTNNIAGGNETERPALTVVTAYTSAEDLFSIAANHLKRLREGLKQSPYELKSLCLDPSTADQTIGQVLQLYERFLEQGEVWEKCSEMPFSFPEGSSSRGLGTKLLKDALQALELALETVEMIPADALKLYLNRRACNLRLRESELETELTSNNWDQRLILQLSEIRSALQLLASTENAHITLRVRAAKICLKLAQAVSKEERQQLIKKAAVYLDAAEKLNPEIAQHQTVVAMRANIPVLQHLL